MPVQSYKETYEDIVTLYDYAQALVETVEDSRITDPYAQQELVIEMVDTLEQSTEVLSEQFLDIAQGDGQSNKIKKTKIESAFRKIFNAIDNYKNKAIVLGKNIADEIVLGLEEHMEHIVAMFLEFVELGVTRFMHFQQIEEMKKREQHVAALLHSASLNHS